MSSGTATPRLDGPGLEELRSAPAADTLSLPVRLWRALGRSGQARLGLGLIVFMVLFSFAGVALTHQSPTLVSVFQSLAPPSLAHPMGTDEYGRDLFARTIYGGQVSIEIGLSVVLVGAVGGTVIGLVAATSRTLDRILMRLVDAAMAVPVILLAIALLALLKPSVTNVVISLGVVAIPRTARVVRASALVAVQEEYVIAARSMGASWLRLTLRHVLPNILSPLIIQSTFNFASAVLNEAALSFLGVGLPPNTPAWGSDLSNGQDYVYQAPWLTVFPGIAIVVMVLGVNLFGDGLRDVLDPLYSRGRS